MKKVIKPAVIFSLFLIVILVRKCTIKRKFYLYDKILGNASNIRNYNIPNDITNNE